jgi:hypothetical protein
LSGNQTPVVPANRRSASSDHRAEDRHPPPSLPDLRASYDAFAQRISQAGDNAASLLPELDQVFDAANGKAEIAGLDPLGSDDEPAA